MLKKWNPRWPSNHGCFAGLLPAGARISKTRRFSKMVRLLVQWLLSAVALLVVSNLVPGFYVKGLGPALEAALVIVLLNATLGFILKIVTFPLSILTLGLFLLVINGLMILLASSIVRGFHVNGFWPAFWGALVLALLGMLIRAVAKRV
jgi:putative membrane protein